MEGIVATALFAILSAVVVWPVASVYTALFAYLVLMHVDMAPAEWSAATAIGAANAFKVVVLPTLLAARTRFDAFRMVFAVRGVRWWIALVAVAVAGALWTPFPVAAVKQLGYMYSYTVLIGVMVWAYRQDERRTTRVVLGAAGTVFVIALVRWFTLVDTARLSSFSTVQGFGLYLVLTIVVVVAATHRGLVSGFVGTGFVVILLAGIVLNGTRTGLATTVMFLAYGVAGWSLLSGGAFRARMARTISMVSLMVGFGLAAGVWTLIAPSRLLALIEGNRSLQTVEVLVGNQQLEDIGTLAWRLGMYAEMIRDIQNRPAFATVLGRGTSSAAAIVTSGDYYYRAYTTETIDANRIAHNEFLRAFYEWGLVGGVIFIGLITTLFGSALKAFRRDSGFESYCIVGGFGIVIVYLGVENLLAAAGTAAGAGVIILTAWLINQFGGGDRALPLLDVKGRQT